MEHIEKISKMELTISPTHLESKTLEHKITMSIHVNTILKEIHKIEKLEISLREYFIVLFLNRGNRVMGYTVSSMGAKSSTVVDTTHLLSTAILSNSSGVILSHNHPSGELNPSQTDIQLTNKLQNALKTLEITLLDHVITAPDYNFINKNYYSFLDEGLL